MAIPLPAQSGVWVSTWSEFRELPIGKGEILRQGNDIAIPGNRLDGCAGSWSSGEIALQGVEATVVNARFCQADWRRTDRWFGNSYQTHCHRRREYTIPGGFGNYVNDAVRQADLRDVIIRNVGLPDVFIEHGGQDFLRSKYELGCRWDYRQSSWR